MAEEGRLSKEEARKEGEGGPLPLPGIPVKAEEEEEEEEEEEACAARRGPPGRVLCPEPCMSWE